MREKIFKGKRKDNGEWVEGYHIVGCEVADYIIPHHSLKNGKAYGGYEAMDGTFYVPEFFEVFPETVRESTGCPDKNKTPIFEGDIVEADGVCEVVRFENGCFYPMGAYVARSGLEYDKNEYEVIGNIYDNPELLK